MDKEKVAAMQEAAQAQTQIIAVPPMVWQMIVDFVREAPVPRKDTDMLWTAMQQCGTATMNTPQQENTNG